MSVWLGIGDQQSLVERDDARVSAFDHGLTVGDGVFETLKVIGGEPIALSRHLRRLRSSANILGLTVPAEDSIRDAVDQVIASEPQAAALGRLRITVTGGVGPLASDRLGGSVTAIVALSAMEAWPATTSAILVPWKRNEYSATTGAKTTSYAENVVALQWAHERGYSEGLFTNTSGDLCEGTGTNVFVVHEGSVSTPPLGSGCLAGITRELLLEWGLASEQQLTVDALATAEEIFVTSSTRDVHPVTRLGDREWSQAGSITRDVSATYIRRISQDIDP